MKPPSQLLRPLLLALGLSLLSACSSTGPAQPAPRLDQPIPGLLTEGIPALPTAPRAAPAYEAPALRFVDWHPQQLEMLVLARHQGLMQLHRLAQAGGRPELLSRGADPVDDARWEPEQGRYLVFSRDQGGDEAFRLYRLDASGPAGEGVALTPAGARVNGFAFLPQGQGLVYLLEQLDRQAQGQGGERRARSWLQWVDPLNPASTRRLGEVEGGRFGDLRVSPGGAITVLRSQGKQSQLLRYTLDGAAPQALGAARQIDSQEDADEEFLWSRLALQGDFRHLVRTSLDSGAREPLLARALGGDLEAVAVPAPGLQQPLALVSNEAGLSALWLYEGRDTAASPRRIATELPAGVLRNPRWHPRYPVLGFSHVWTQSPGQLYSWDARDQRLQAWSGADEKNQPLRTELLRWKSFDGLEITGLHTPPPARFSGPRPVYISLHGGPASQSRPGYLSATLRQLVEEQGVHLIQPNVRGSDGFGKRFLALDNGRLRENATRDVSALLDLIARRPDMDAAKVIVAGGSYGGYLTLAVAAAEAPRIAGSICRVGIANFVSFLENTESYRRDNRRAEYGDERDPAMREFLTRISPLSRVQQMSKPMFIVHGRNDPRVPYGEAQQMAAALQAQGTPLWFLTAEEEGHSVAKPANRDYLQRATLEFVRRVLAGQALSAP